MACRARGQLHLLRRTKAHRIPAEDCGVLLEASLFENLARAASSDRGRRLRSENNFFVLRGA